MGALSIGPGVWSRLGLGLSGGLRTVPPSQYALYLDFKNQNYWEAGTNKALSSVTGYTFTDSVDNVPNIDASGYTSLVAEASSLSFSLAIGSTEDFVAWSACTFSASASADNIFLQIDDGTNSNRVLIYREGTSNLQRVLAQVASVSVAINAPTLVATPSGRLVLLVSRQSGVTRLGFKLPDGSVSFASGSTTSDFFAATNIRVGHRSGQRQTDAPISGVFVRRGVFSTADCQAILAAA